MKPKPIKIVRVDAGYHVFVNNVPVVKNGKGVTFDKRQAGLKTPAGYQAPATLEPFLIEKANTAAALAHQILSVRSRRSQRLRRKLHRARRHRWKPLSVVGQSHTLGGSPCQSSIQSGTK